MFFYMIIILKKKMIKFKKKTIMNWENFYQDLFKINFLHSLLKLHLLKIALRPNSRPSLINQIKYLNNQKNNWWLSYNNSINNRNRLKKNYLLSTQKHWASQKLLKWSIKYQSSSHHNYLFLRLLHPFMKVWSA